MFGRNKSQVIVDETQIDALLSRGIENIFPSKDFLKAKMMKGEKVTLYLGIDPTGPTLHIGHLVPIKKLSQFQKLGHQIILLVGDFTAMIGDPTDKTATRKKLSKEEVLENLAHYQKQASKFLSFSGENKAMFKMNSEWLGKMSFSDVLDLASYMTVDQMLKRDMFARRVEEGKPIYIHEFLYPLMQGFDSVAMDVDGEIGGNDQTFNMLAGRDLLKTIKNKEKFVIACKLLTDPTGKKMGKSEGNMVAFNQSPEDMFGKVMSWPDTMIIPVFEILTDLPLSEIEQMKEDLRGGQNPKDIKMRLAREIVTMCYDEGKAKAAQEQFEHTFARGGVPEDTLECLVAKGSKLVDIALAENIITSKTEWRRLVQDGAVSNMTADIKINDPDCVVSDTTYKIGKRRFIKIITK